MKQYLLLVQGNLESRTTPEEWNAFFAAAEESGHFRGGSEIGRRTVLGNVATAQSTDHVVAYMRFDAEDRQQLLELLEKHPVIVRGGSAELCELPES